MLRLSIVCALAGAPLTRREAVMMVAVMMSANPRHEVISLLHAFKRVKLGAVADV